MKSILNTILQGEHDHFLQLMYELIIDTPYLDIQGGVFCEILEEIYRNISGVHCIYRMAFHCFVWIESVVVDTFVLWVNKRNWNETLMC